jgi:hypothetical protein
MRIKGLLLFLAFVISSFVSCIRENPHAEKIKTLDSLYIVLDAVEKDLIAIDHDYAQKTHDEIIRNVDFIKKEFKDTLSMEDSKFFAAYRTMRKPYLKVAHYKLPFAEELAYTKSQMKNLSKDIKNQTLSAEDINEFFNTEYEAAKGIAERSREMIDKFENTETAFKESHPRVLEFIEKNIISKNN